MPQRKANLERALECEAAARAAAPDERRALLLLARRFRLLAEHAEAHAPTNIGIEGESEANRSPPAANVSNPPGSR